MNDVSLRSKLLIVLLIVALVSTLGTCTARRARSSIRARRVDEVEFLLSE